jgi:hypothetical protein
MASAPRLPPSASIDEIATIRIELRDTDPVIWREVEAPISVTLQVLHEIVQAALGWQDAHLWELTIDRRHYGPPTQGEAPSIEAAKVRLRDILKPSKTSIDYLYDFGDSWEHRLTVTRVRHAEPGILYPRYVGGEWNAPPEDCGGTPGFYEALDALADPRHPNHADVKEWFGGYDPTAIDRMAIEQALGRIGKRRNVA